MSAGPTAQTVASGGPLLRGEPRPSDLEAVRRIVSATGRFSAEESAIAVSLVRERLEQGPGAGYEFLFADTPGGLGGYTCFGAIPGTRESFDLYWIAVDPALQGRGIGQRLLAATEEQVRARGGRRLYADTSGRRDYAATRAFYERAGYRAEATLPDFYAPGDPKLIYVKELGPTPMS